MGRSQDEACEQVAAGAADALWDVAPPGGDPSPAVQPVSATHGELNPCLVINLVSPNADRATSRRDVRLALRWAVDKDAIARIYGGAERTVVTGRLLPPGHLAERPLLSTPGVPACGDPERARELLARAGYRDGLTLRMIHRDGGHHPAVARAVRTALARAGIEVELVPVPQSEFYPRYLEVAANARAGVWDLTTQGWLPDWPGDNARSYLQPHFDSSRLSLDDQTWGVVYGCYRSAATNHLIRCATTAPDSATANALYHLAEARVLDDVAVVPVLFQRSRTLYSRRVRGITTFPNYLGDPTQMWLER